LKVVISASAAFRIFATARAGLALKDFYAKPFSPSVLFTNYSNLILIIFLHPMMIFLVFHKNIFLYKLRRLHLPSNPYYTKP
jgi:hypothetical protein